MILNPIWTCRRICAAFGGNCVSDRTAQEWFKRFGGGDFFLEDKPRSGCPMQFNEEALRQMLEQKSRKTTRELAQSLGAGHSTVHNRVMTFSIIPLIYKVKAFYNHDLFII